MYKKIVLFFICLSIILSFSGCISISSPENETGKPNQPNRRSEYSQMVISSHSISPEEYYIESQGGTDYIMIRQDAFEPCFRIPYMINPFPSVTLYEDGQISIVWGDEYDTYFLQIDLQVGSTKAILNGNEYEMGMAPVIQNGVLYIPSNFFISLLEMESEFNRELDTFIVDRTEDFPKEILVGNWSDINTNLFVGYQDLVSGAVSLPSYAESYSFTEDGSYRTIIISTGGFEDAFILHEGKYQVYGNTIVAYNVRETLYKGTPLKLVHEDKLLDKPYYERINNYNPDENKIQLTFWLYRVD